LYITHENGAYKVSTTEITGSTKVLKQNGCWTIEGSSSVVVNNAVLDKNKSSSLFSFPSFFQSNKTETESDKRKKNIQENSKGPNFNIKGGKSKTKKRVQKRRGFKSRSKK